MHMYLISTFIRRYRYWETFAVPLPDSFTPPNGATFLWKIIAFVNCPPWPYFQGFRKHARYAQYFGNRSKTPSQMGYCSPWQRLLLRFCNLNQGATGTKDFVSRKMSMFRVSQSNGWAQETLARCWLASAEGTFAPLAIASLTNFSTLLMAALINKRTNGNAVQKKPFASWMS